jgi:cytochrome oxidase Cu insertion factor (SCO1/SenC/PrrC family)
MGRSPYTYSLNPGITSLLVFRRTTLVGEAANPWSITGLSQVSLTYESRQSDDDVQLLDTLTLVVLTYTRAPHACCVTGETDYVHNTTERLHHDGFKRG